MSINRLFASALALLLLAAGCRSQREASRPVPPSPSVEETPGTVPHYTPRYYTANFTGSAEGYTANGQIRIQADSIVWLSASKVIELARARFTPDSVLIYVKVLNRSFQGTYMDVYKRFHYRTTFDELYQTLMSDDAEAQLAAIIGKFGVEVELHMDPMKEVEQLNFPIAIPARSNPL
jgi:hypothetical protein